MRLHAAAPSEPPLANMYLRDFRSPCGIPAIPGLRPGGRPRPEEREQHRPGHRAVRHKREGCPAMTKSYPKDIKAVRPKRMLSRELVRAGLDVAGGEPAAVATRPEARGRAGRAGLPTESPIGQPDNINAP